jgi:hypothetical protein
MRSRLLCAAGAILLLSSVPAAHLASVQGHKDIIRNLDNTITPMTRSAARTRFAAESRKRDTTAARPPDSVAVDIIGTAPMKEITVIDAVAVSVPRLPSAQWNRGLMAGLNLDLARYHSSIGGLKQKSSPMSGNRRGPTPAK